MFYKVLIANRGEIAVRITKTLQEMGIKAVAVYSDIDEDSLHVEYSDEAYPLYGSTSKDTYLNIEKIIDIAKVANVDAIHPGYGFLSENPRFAQACLDANIIFIGPSPNVIAEMGDKILAKKAMTKANVPVVPGWSGNISDIDEIKNVANKIGYPVLVKAAAGGGGKGMRIVKELAELEQSIESAGREAQNAFGDSRVFIEKYIMNPRHIEFQIFGDVHGSVIHLFERECSIQRRHQKIIEESPSSALTPELRKKMGEAAVMAGKAIGYTNAGTVEFILDENKNFYFLEVNTRLQVEHPVTESIIHGDLVKAQILVAMGEKLSITQNDVTQDGHAIECRIYAEDPQNRFFPSTGMLEVYIGPTGPGIRVDSGVKQGSAISVHYDPMLAKLITYSKTRNAAIEKMLWALNHYPVLGITTNISFLHDVINHSVFRSGDIDTHFLEKYNVLDSARINKDKELAIALSGLICDRNKNTASLVVDNNQQKSNLEPWLNIGNWRM